MTDQVLEDCENMLAILHDPLQKRAQVGLAYGFFIPLGAHGGGNLNIAPQFIGGMAAQEHPIKKGSLALRELEVL